jgi:lipopolysaccharide transport system ATP-binding protein
MKNNVVLKAENISKQYRLGYVGSGSLKDDAQRWWARMRGKEDPLLTIGEINDRSSKGESDYVWALKDINFEIEQGDTVGIIGRNGAGKSTLLKILSKVTAPTTGNIKVKGRIASLLEVGTGFHGELTGRENIYLNGAIMGMRKHEITRKLDEIVDFAGVERYLDTPVKRYSSGMYVRLGFAVAAHLENEILIVDEVLAVGDAEFQRKCLGKMRDVANGEGRTILFVSHNIAAIQNLCKKGIYLLDGKIMANDIIDDSIHEYYKNFKSDNTHLSLIKSRKGNGDLIFVDGKIKSNNGDIIETFNNLFIELFFKLKDNVNINQFKIEIGVNNDKGIRVAWMSTDMSSVVLDIINNRIKFEIYNIPLSPGNYNLNLYCELNNDIADWIFDVLPFTIVEKDYYGTGKVVSSSQGFLLLNYIVS